MRHFVVTHPPCNTTTFEVCYILIIVMKLHPLFGIPRMVRMDHHLTVREVTILLLFAFALRFINFRHIDNRVHLSLFLSVIKVILFSLIIANQTYKVNTFMPIGKYHNRPYLCYWQINDRMGIV